MSKKQPKSKTFTLATPRDLLGKLHSDLQDLQEAPTWNGSLRIHRAIDCFLTLWHMADWFWVALRSDQEAFARWKKKHPEARDFSSLQERLCQHCLAMRVAQQVATASKHLHVGHEDKAVAAEVAYEQAGNFRIPQDIVIEVDGVSMHVESVVAAGLAFWTALLDEITR
jgi:hypothetical protein